MAAEPAATTSRPAVVNRPDLSIPTSAQWKQLDQAVDRGLKFLATQQLPNGSFTTQRTAEPAVTSFCVMAFLSRGHTPLQGTYREQIRRAIEFVLSTQQQNGLLYADRAGTELWKLAGNYNHPIGGVMLSEVYGMAESKQQEAIRAAIEQALRFTREQQVKPKRWRDDNGGWRYLAPSVNIDSDLSITAWHLMFYRSARNAEFDIPEEYMKAAVAYVERCYDDKKGTFAYGLRGYGRDTYSRGMAGAGVVSLAMAGKHQTKMAQRRPVCARPSVQPL